MNKSTEFLVAMAGLAVAAFLALIGYRWRQRDRVHRIKAWVSHYLSSQYGAAPARLNINCSNDPLWPVLAGFDDPTTGTRQVLRFACAGSSSTWAVDSKTDALFPLTTPG